MRVYEYAKEHHVSSKVIIAKLGEIGIQVKSHMSIIADNAMSQLDRKMNGHAGASAQNITNKSKAEGKVNQTNTKEKKPNQTTSHVKNKPVNSRSNGNRSGEGSNRRSSGRNQNANNNNNNERNRLAATAEPAAAETSEGIVIIAEEARSKPTAKILRSSFRKKSHYPAL
nr:translation initiation factor IF-2 N-terminal domain-containing protein [Sporolactobacillus inulinus]